MPHVMTTLPSIASMTQEANRAEIDTVGELDSSLVIYSCCGRPSAHPCALIFPHCFCFRNIRYARDFCQTSFVTSYLVSIRTTFRPIRFSLSSFMAALRPSSPNTFIPLLNPYCGVDSVASRLPYSVIVVMTKLCSSSVVSLFQ